MFDKQYLIVWTGPKVLLISNVLACDNVLIRLSYFGVVLNIIQDTKKACDKKPI